MDRPPLEVADLVRAAGIAFIERNRSGSAGRISRSCSPLRAAARPCSAAISMSAPVVDIVPPSPITAVVTATAQNARPATANGGSRHVVENFSRALCPYRFHSATTTGSAGSAE